MQLSVCNNTRAPTRAYTDRNCISVVKAISSAAMTTNFPVITRIIKPSPQQQSLRNPVMRNKIFVGA